MIPLQLFPELSLVFLAILSVSTRNPRYYRILAGGILTIFIGALLKKMTRRMTPFVPESIILRPKGARNCNFTQKGLCERETGMPSIHSMIAGYYASKLRCHNKAVALSMILVPLSRLQQDEFPIINHGEYGCHTWAQISIGFLLGIHLGNIF